MATPTLAALLERLRTAATAQRSIGLTGGADPLDDAAKTIPPTANASRPLPNFRRGLMTGQTVLQQESYEQLRDQGIDEDTAELTAHEWGDDGDHW